MEAPVLVQPDPFAPFRLECNASKKACGAVLSQKGDDGLWHPVAFMSKSFIEAERNYDIYDRELLAIIKALEEWRHYLEGSPHDIEILSDHKNLKIFKEARKLSRRQARWALYLSRFHFTITHVPGRSMGKPDALSQRPDHEEGDDDNEDHIILPATIFNRVIQIDVTASPLFNQICDCQALDRDIASILRTLLANGESELKRGLSKHWTISNGAILHKGWLYVPHDPELRRNIMSLHHDTPGSGHPGHLKTYKLLSQSFWWTGMRRFVKDYVDGCATCQSTKNLTNCPSTPLQPILPEMDTAPFSTVSMDFIVELPISQGYDAIAVFVDHDVTKAAVFAPCSTSITTDQTATLYCDYIWKHFGLPQKLISDHGPQFTSSFSTELCKLLDIQQAMSTAYHTQTDGQTERVNRELEQYLRAYCSVHQNDWADHLSTAEFAHNVHHHSTIDTSPFCALMGYQPTSLPLSTPSSSTPTVSA